jgi:hypothetical protein
MQPNAIPRWLVLTIKQLMNNKKAGIVNHLTYCLSLISSKKVMYGFF